MRQIFRTSAGELRWGWKAALMILGTIVFGLILNTVLIAVLAGAYVSQGLAQSDAIEAAGLSAGGFVAQVILSVLQVGFMLGLVGWLVTKIEKRTFAWDSLGFVSDQRSSYIWLGVALALVLGLLTIGIGVLAGTLEFTGSGFTMFPAPQVLFTCLLAAVLALASGFGEEIAFRGYLQSCIAQRYNPVVAVVIVAVLFALSHPVVDAEHPLLYLASALGVGIFFGTIFARTGSLWMGIALHVVWNYLQIALLAVRHSADERFFGAPLLVFDTVSAAAQGIIELVVIVIGILSILWLTKRDTITRVQKGEQNVASHS